MKMTIVTLLIGILSNLVLASDYEIIDNYVKKNKQLINLPSGTAIAIIKDQKIVYEGYFGYADIEKKTEVNSDTVFYIASMTKPFYSLLTLLKESQGKLKTNQTLKELLPEVDFVPAIRANEVTIKDLLSHTSGIDNWPLVQVTAYTGQYNSKSLSEIISQSYVNDKAPLGSYSYTNVGYNILSHWMDSKFESNWQEMLSKEIFEPLNMTKTSALMSDIDKNNWQDTRGYSVKSPKPSAPVYLRKTDKTMHAAGGMVSTARDLAKFLIAEVNLGKVKNKQVFPSEVVGESHQSLINYKRHDRKFSYGWGWDVRSVFGETLLEHRGGYSGASTYISFMPDKKIGLVVLSNQDKWGGDLAFALEDLAYAISLDKPHDEVIKLSKKNEKFVEKNVKKFYEKKSSAQHRLITKLSNEYLGKYKHETLGEIEIFRDVQNGYSVQWGNLKSKLYAFEKSENIGVEFVPNQIQPIVLLRSSNDDMYLEFNDYRFTK
jgi:CubicO group peptidase (beta-lactamase class C family)